MARGHRRRPERARPIRRLALAVLALGLFVGACGEPEPSAERAGVESAATTRAAGARIVSVGASVTETLFALGLGDAVVAVDRTSVYPEATHALPKVGLPGQLSVEGVAAVEPTLIIADGAGHGAAPSPADQALSQLEGLGLAVTRLGEAPITVEAAAARIEAIGRAVGRVDEARALAAQMTREVKAALERRGSARPRALFVYARGHRTLLVSGTGTPAHELLTLAGADNAVTAFSDFKPMSAETVIASKPEVIVIPERGLASLGGLDGLLALPGIMDTPAGRQRRVVAIDDLELLTFGPRLGRGLDKLIAGLHGVGAR